MVNEYNPTLTENADAAQTSSLQNSAHSMNTLPKSFRKILTTLYSSPCMAQKVLAANLQKSPTNLSNIIARMNVITPQFLTCEKNGRTVCYSLTEEAKRYVEEKLLPEEPAHTVPLTVCPADNLTPSTGSGSPSSDSPRTAETKRFLTQFQAKAGAGWAIILDNYLYHEHGGIYEKNDFNFDQSLYNLYDGFMNNMTLLRLEEDFSSIHQIYSILGNEILTQRIDSYFNVKLEGHYSLLPLFELEKRNTEKAFTLIDYIFTQIKDTVSPDTDMSFAALPVNRQEYLLIKDRINIMVKGFSKYHGNVLQAVRDWQKEFFTANTCLYFIALECEAVYMMRKHSDE